jgi:hypothetical protein
MLTMSKKDRRAYLEHLVFSTAVEQFSADAEVLRRAVVEFLERDFERPCDLRRWA